MLSFLSSFAESIGIALQFLGHVLESITHVFRAIFEGLKVLAYMYTWIPAFVLPFVVFVVTLSIIYVVVDR